MNDDFPPCCHCHEYHASRARGLCNRCYCQPEVRRLHPCRPRGPSSLAHLQRDPQRPPRARLVGCREARAGQLAARYAQGYSLFGPDDYRRMEDDMETIAIDAGAWVRCQDCGEPQSGSILRREDGHLLCGDCAGRRIDAEAHVQALYAEHGGEGGHD